LGSRQAVRAAGVFTVTARRQKELRQLGAYVARKLLYTSRSIRSRLADAAEATAGEGDRQGLPARINRIRTATVFAEIVNQEKRL